MIVKMSKVAIIGPKNLLTETLTAIQEMAVLHIDAEIKKDLNTCVEPYLKSPVYESQGLADRFFFENLRNKIDTLLSYLPPEIKGRHSFLSPASAVNFLADVLPKHIANCQGFAAEKEQTLNELKSLFKHKEFIKAITPLLPDESATPDIDYVGFTVPDDKELSRLGEKLYTIIGSRFAISTTIHKNRIYGLITTEKELMAQIRSVLEKNKILEQKLPDDIVHLPFQQQVTAIRKLIGSKEDKVAQIDEKLRQFAYSWGGVYRDFRKWIEDKLSLIQAAGCIYETDMCFIVFGWLPAAELLHLKKKLSDMFQDKIVVEEKEIREHDLEKVPTYLKNPPYFKPFELFSRLLPLPSYGSFDITPFLGIFFPVFFGLMLGDIGYGLVILFLCFIINKIFHANQNARDAARIFAVAAIYTIIFGFLYGEFFGSIGADIFHLKPIFFDRHHSIMPMLYFAVALGTVHVLLGLLLGLIASLRKHSAKEALFKMISIALILGFIFLTAVFFMDSVKPAPQVLLISFLILLPVLLFAGGLLAPLEVLKHFGNIISYARIMAIGLTSVLLAYVANYLAGMTGSLWIGILVGLLLHGFNIVLGIFAPTIHSLRLHYVEFLSKFMETGGTAFKPLKKGP